jgi:hypothetical protein
MPTLPSAELSQLISRERAENEFRKALSLYVGRGRRWSIEQLAKGVGCKAKAIYDFQSYPHGHPDHRPLNFGAILSIALFLGPDFTNEWLPLANQGAFELPGDDPSPGDLAAENSEDNAAIVRAATDGFDKSEGPNLTVVGGRMVTRGKQLVAIGSRGQGDLFNRARVA